MEISKIKYQKIETTNDGHCLNDSIFLIFHFFSEGGSASGGHF